MCKPRMSMETKAPRNILLIHSRSYRELLLFMDNAPISENSLNGNRRIQKFIMLQESRPFEFVMKYDFSTDR